MSAVLFDALGTLFDLTPLRERLGDAALESWFERLLHSAATLTLTRQFRPFDELAETTLATTAARLEMEVEPSELVDLFGELPPFADAPTALRAAKDASVEVAVLTNGSNENTRTLLESAGLLACVDRIFTTADVEAYKPAAAPYEHAVRELGLDPQDVTLISAHGWDVLGARNARLQAIWVDREERRWPFPLGEPRRVVDLVSAVELALT